MFGIDFPELVVIAVVALIVLGPERLPKAARFAGLWVRRARAQWSSVKNELERELAADEFRRSLHDTEAAMREIDADVRAADAQARREFDTMRGNMAGNGASADNLSSGAPAATTAPMLPPAAGEPFDTLADFDPHAAEPHAVDPHVVDPHAANLNAAHSPTPHPSVAPAALTPSDHRDAPVDDDAPVLMTGPAVPSSTPATLPTHTHGHRDDPRSG